MEYSAISTDIIIILLHKCTSFLQLNITIFPSSTIFIMYYDATEQYFIKTTISLLPLLPRSRSEYEMNVYVRYTDKTARKQSNNIHPLNKTREERKKLEKTMKNLFYLFPFSFISFVCLETWKQQYKRKKI